MVCTSLKVQPRFVQFLVWNPCQFFQSSTILVPLWFIFTKWYIFTKYGVFLQFQLSIVSAFLQFRGEFVA